MSMPGKRAIFATVLGVVAAVSVDFLLHAGLLADLYERESDFLLPLQSAFNRIPLGYGAFTILTGYLVWLITRLDRRSIAGGAMTGLGFGVVVWGALVLGLLSISTIELDLALAWWLGQSAELAISGSVAGWVLSGVRWRGPVLLTVLLLLFCLVAGIVLQNLPLTD